MCNFNLILYNLLTELFLIKSIDTLTLFVSVSITRLTHNQFK